MYPLMTKPFRSSSYNELEMELMAFAGVIYGGKA